MLSAEELRLCIAENRVKLLNESSEYKKICEAIEQVAKSSEVPAEVIIKNVKGTKVELAAILELLKGQGYKVTLTGTGNQDDLEVITLDFKLAF